MPLHPTVPADGLRDPSAIPTYLSAFRRYMADKGLDVRVISLDAFLDHHARCGYEPFTGWSEGGCILWGVYQDSELIATWAVKPYLLGPGESLRGTMENRGLYATDDETWRVDGPAADLADTVVDLAVFEGGLCIPAHWRKTAEAEVIIREMGLFSRASAVHHWACPWTWFLVKKPRLAERFGAEHLAGTVTWLKGNALKDGITRKLGLSSAQWIAERCAAWPAQER